MVAQGRDMPAPDLSPTSGDGGGDTTPANPPGHTVPPRPCSCADPDVTSPDLSIQGALSSPSSISREIQLTDAAEAAKLPAAPALVSSHPRCEPCVGELARDLHDLRQAENTEALKKREDHQKTQQPKPSASLPQAQNSINGAPPLPHPTNSNLKPTSPAMSQGLMEDPDPDPLLHFLVPPGAEPTPPPRSTPSPTINDIQIPDLSSLSPELSVEVHLARDLLPSIEIGAVRGEEELPHPQANGISEQESAHQPSSPTEIDQDLQNQARALLPELARDLHNINIQTGSKEKRALNASGEQQLSNPFQGNLSSNVQINTAPSPGKEAGDSASQKDQALQDELLRSRIPAWQKGKRSLYRDGIQEDDGERGFDQQASFSASASSEFECTRLHVPQWETDFNEDGWEAAKPHRRKRIVSKISQVQISNQSTDKMKGTLLFKEKMKGKCFNCFSPNHNAHLCHSPARCWKCYLLGHRAVDCPIGSSKIDYKRDKYTELQHTSNNSKLHQHTKIHQTIDLRSFADVVRGQGSMAARYPGDPRARPLRGSCAVSATGPIKRRRDDLIGRAAICWLDSESHDTETYHVGDALRCQLHLRREDMQIVKHYPENFLIIFSDPRVCAMVLDQGAIVDGGRRFNFGVWNERLHAENITWEFRVKVRIEGIPVHCWAEEAAAKSLGGSCAIHYAEERTRRRERTRSFDVWAWCSDPCDIPAEMLLTVLEADKEQTPTSVPLCFAPPHHDDPTGVKRGHLYILRNHLEVVEDLTFMQGNARAGGHPNRKARREFNWSYGIPDYEGERVDRRIHHRRGRDIQRHHRRDDDDFDDHRHHGARRPRSLSVWSRTSRCRGGPQDCMSSNAWRGRRNSPSRRSRRGHEKTMVWSKKADTTSKQVKKVTFADPIAVVLKPHKPRVIDDSIQFIKERAVDNKKLHMDKENGDSTVKMKKKSEQMQAEEMDQHEAVHQTEEDKENEEEGTLQEMQNNMQPVEKSKMKAIQVLIEKGSKEMKATPKKKSRILPMATV